VTAARAVLCLLSLVLPVALWPGSTAYESAKLLLWAWAAAAWLVIAALAAARGRVGPAPVRGLVVAGLAMIAVQAPALALADSPHLAGRALLWSAVWWLTATVVAATARETRHRQRLLACATAGAATTCGVALLQLAGVAPAPANPYVPVGIGTLGNENSVSELAAAWLLPSLLLPLSMRRRAWRAVGLLPALVMAAMLAASDAAAARVGAAAAVAFALAGEAMLRSRRPDRVPLLLGALVSAGALAAGVLVSQVQRGGPLASNQDLLSARVLAANHGAERRADWLVASELWRRAPLTGCGAGNYGVNWLRTRADLAVAAETAKQVEAVGAKCISIQADISDEKAVEKLARRSIKEYGKVDVLVNNAGISQLGFIPTEESSIEEWDRVIGVNLRGTFLCCKRIGKEIDRKSVV